jgi:hypothetical protein
MGIISKVTCTTASLFLVMACGNKAGFQSQDESMELKKEAVEETPTEKGTLDSQQTAGATGNESATDGAVAAEKSDTDAGLSRNANDLSGDVVQNQSNILGDASGNGNDVAGDAFGVAEGPAGVEGNCVDSDNENDAGSIPEPTAEAPDDKYACKHIGDNWECQNRADKIVHQIPFAAFPFDGFSCDGVDSLPEQ